MQRVINVVFTTAVALMFSITALCQYPGWQQKADYTMNIDVDVEKHQ